MLGLGWRDDRTLDICHRIAVVIGFFLSIACIVFSLRMTFNYMDSPSNFFESLQQTYWKFHLVLHLCMETFFHLILIYKTFRKVHESMQLIALRIATMNRFTYFFSDYNAFRSLHRHNKSSMLYSWQRNVHTINAVLVRARKAVHILCVSIFSPSFQ